VGEFPINLIASMLVNNNKIKENRVVIPIMNFKIFLAFSGNLFIKKLCEHGALSKCDGN